MTRAGPLPRRAGRWFGGGALLLGLTALPAPTARAASAATDELPAAVTITALTPRAPQPGMRLQLRGTVHNRGEVTLRDVQVRLRAATQPVGSRSELSAQAASPDELVGFVIDGRATTVELPDLPAGAIAGYQLSIAVDRLQLPGSGVYPVGVDVRATTDQGFDTAGRVRTWLPFTTRSDGYQPTRIGWLWPLADLPDRNPDGTFPAERLPSALAADGRLGGLLSAVASARRGPRRVPLTYAVDPALLEAVGALADGYQVRPAGQPPRAGTGQVTAGRFLDRLRPSVANDAVLALPYADPDLVALVRAGRSADVSLAAAAPAFTQILGEVLGVRPLRGLVWPPQGLLTRSTLEVLPGVDTLVLSGEGLPADPDLPYTPDAVTELPSVAGGTVRVLVSDPTIDDLVATPPRRPTDLRLAEQRFLAETMLVTAERPAQSRAVVVAPPRQWAPPPGWAATLLRDSATVPWLRPVALPDLAPLAEPGSTRGALRYPSSARDAELPTSLLFGPRSVATVSQELARFRSILTNPNGSGVPELERSLLRCESAAWRDRLAGARRLRQQAAATLDRVSGRVRISSSGTVSLASRNSTIPVSVANGLDQPVRVQIGLRSNRAQLTARETGVRLITGGHQVTVDVQVRASSGGVFPVYLTLLTPEGRPYAAPIKLLVHSSSYGTLAVAITFGAFVVLVLAATVRLSRRLRTARRARPAR